MYDIRSIRISMCICSSMSMMMCSTPNSIGGITIFILDSISNVIYEMSIYIRISVRSNVGPVLLSVLVSNINKFSNICDLTRNDLKSGEHLLRSILVTILEQVKIVLI